jgi:hypothetical protein
MLVPMTLMIDTDKRGSQRGSLSTRASAAEDVQPSRYLILKQKEYQQWDTSQEPPWKMRKMDGDIVSALFLMDELLLRALLRVQ